MFFLLLFSISCTQKATDIDRGNKDSLSLLDQVYDTLQVATMYGSNSYFEFRDGEIMGYDYELLNDFSDYTGVPVKIHFAKTQDQMIKMLRSGQVDLIACSMYETKALISEFDFVAYQEDSYMVLVQEIGLNTLSEFQELRGQTVHVIKNSIYQKRLENINKELGLSIDIQLLDDTTTVDEAIEMVSKRKIRFTIAHYKIAVQHKNFNRRLDCRIAVGFPQRNGWLINKDDDALKDMITDWDSSSEAELERSQLYGKYLVRNPYFVTKKVRIPKGAISPYDLFFKKYAKEINWDWMLLASVAFHESRFDSAQISRRGASGLMQLMPKTAASFGLNVNNILNPEKNIEAGVQYIKSLNLLFRKIENLEERKKFILASYNSGPAHIIDAMALAEKYGKNPHIWYEHVEYYLSKKNEPQYYNDEVVKFGNFRAHETIRYVRNTIETYQKYKGKI
ncbi:transporter substrate-binding domain-containing protein [Paludibacter sp.]